MHLTSTFRYRLLFTLICCASMAVWFSTGRGLSNSVEYNQQLTRVQQIEVQLARRVENAIDFSVTAYSELLFTDTSTCNIWLRNKLRRLVLDAGGVTDIYVLTGDGLCSVFDELSHALPDRDIRENWLVGRNPAYRVGVIPGYEHNLIGVSRGLDLGSEVVIALNPETMLYDLVHSDQLAHTQATLMLGDEVIATFGGAAIEMADPNDLVTYARTGQRYPITTRVQTDSAALRAVKRAVPTTIWVSWVLVGLMTSFAFAYFCLRRFDPEVEDVKHGIKSRQIRPYFQPIVDTHSGRVLGCEALARWIKAEDRIVPPNSFIPVVERAGLDDDLLRQLISATAQDLRAVFDSDPTFYAGFNATSAQFSRQGFAEEVLALLDKFGLPPSQICIEITERQVISDIETATRNAQHLKAQNVRLAIDDAGTGHNGLAALQLLDLGVLKIDKFFVDSISADPRSRIMLDTFVSVARRSGMRTVAEGVETAEQVSVLAGAGVGSLQGYFISRPIPGAEFAARFFTEWTDSAMAPPHQNVVNF